MLGPEQAMVISFEVELDDVAALYLIKAKLSNTGEKGSKVAKGGFAIVDDSIFGEQEHH